MRSDDVFRAASGRWPEILVGLGGIRPEQLCSREGPCPHCSANNPQSTRFRWDQDAGAGAWYCSHCGGKNGGGGGGNGLDLLSRLLGHGWGAAAMKPTLQAVERWLGLGSPAPGAASLPPRKPVKSAPRPPSQRQAFALLAAAGQLADGEMFVSSRRGYSSRWLRWSEQASPDEVAAALAAVAADDLEAESERGVWGAEAAAEAAREAAAEAEESVASAQPARATTLDDARATLRAALHDGGSRSDLAALVALLGRSTELGAGSIGALLRALELEQGAADAVAIEQERLAAAARHQDQGGKLLLAQLFPASLAQSITRLIEFLPANDPAAALLVLSAAAGVQKLGSEIIVSRRLGWRAPLNLYSAIVGRSGIKKDPLINALLTRPLAPIAADLAAAHERALLEWRDENRGKKRAEQSDPPRPTFLSVAEFTGEALAQQLQLQEARGLGLMIRRAELAALFGGLNAYRRGRGGDEEQLLESYDGGGGSSLRVSSDGGGRFYRSSQLTICGGIQPAVLRSLIGDGSDASGLWARFIFSPVPDRVVALPSDDSEEEARITLAAEVHLADVVGALFRRPRVSLNLTPEARNLCMEFEHSCQERAQRAGLDAMRAAWSKAAGKVVRVAGLLHLIHEACKDGEHGTEVSDGMVFRAISLVDHLTHWCLGLHEAAGEGGASELMRLIHQLALAAGGPIGWRAIAQRLSSRQRREVDSAAALAAVDGLVALGVGLKEDGRQQGSWHYRATRDLPS